MNLLLNWTPPLITGLLSVFLLKETYINAMASNPVETIIAFIGGIASIIITLIFVYRTTISFDTKKEKDKPE